MLKSKAKSEKGAKTMRLDEFQRFRLGRFLGFDAREMPHEAAALSSPNLSLSEKSLHNMADMIFWVWRGGAGGCGTKRSGSKVSRSRKYTRVWEATGGWRRSRACWSGALSSESWARCTRPAKAVRRTGRC